MRKLLTLTMAWIYRAYTCAVHEGCDHRFFFTVVRTLRWEHFCTCHLRTSFARAECGLSISCDHHWQKHCVHIFMKLSATLSAIARVLHEWLDDERIKETTSDHIQRLTYSKITRPLVTLFAHRTFIPMTLNDDQYSTRIFWQMTVTMATTHDGATRATAVIL